MTAASLGVASPAWRAGRAAAAMHALLDGEVPADDVLAGLRSLGTPQVGWWDVLAAVRAGACCLLLLPRPGDPRGLALPRDADATGAVGWPRPGGSTWLIPGGDLGWRVHEAPGLCPAPADVAEADRMLRAAIVEAAHVIDVLESHGEPVGDSARREQERLVDSWVLGPPALPRSSRALAALGLRMLLAIDGARALVDTRALESAARNAVEVAFSTVRAHG